MTIPSNQPSNHTLHAFDAELDKLHALLLDMTDLLVSQLELSVQALENADVGYAQNAVALDIEIDRYELMIDAEVLEILAKFSPVANDLRSIISISKMVVELEKIGDEFASFAELVISGFDSKENPFNSPLQAEIIKISRHILSALNKIRTAFQSEDTGLLYSILQADRAQEIELHQNIQRQLRHTLQNDGNIGGAMASMQMAKLLEFCGSQCRRIAEHMILTIDRVDVRHQN